MVPVVAVVEVTAVAVQPDAIAKETTNMKSKLAVAVLMVVILVMLMFLVSQIVKSCTKDNVPVENVETIQREIDQMTDEQKAERKRAMQVGPQ